MTKVDNYAPESCCC